MKLGKRKHHRPVHPLLVRFPVALLLSASVLHLLFAFGLQQVWPVALWLIGLGLGSGFFALVSGVMDLVHFIVEEKRTDAVRIVFWHIAIVSAAIFLYMLTFAYCLNLEPGTLNQYSLLLTLSGLSATTLLAGAFCGRLLVRRHGIAKFGGR